MSVTVTDQQVLDELQYAVIEAPNHGASWPSGLWAVAEITEYLNEAQFQFLKATNAVQRRATLVTTPNVHRQPLPADWIATTRVAWTSPTGAISELPRASEAELDYAAATWGHETAARPEVYTDAETPSLQIEVAPAAWDGGILTILYTALSATLSNTGIVLTVPDECAPAIKWKVLALMLGKAGRGQDLVRAAYCEARYQEIVQAVQLLVAGAIV
jgi:hypothetical protein